jgi:hypothetical protein
LIWRLGNSKLLCFLSFPPPLYLKLKVVKAIYFNKIVTKLLKDLDLIKLKKIVKVVNFQIETKTLNYGDSMKKTIPFLSTLGI